MNSYKESASDYSYIKFAVFGLGNSDSQEYCLFPRRIDQFFSNLRCIRLLGLELADDKLDQKKFFKQWMAKIVTSIDSYTQVRRPSYGQEQLNWRIEKEDEHVIGESKVVSQPFSKNMKASEFVGSQGIDKIRTF